MNSVRSWLWVSLSMAGCGWFTAVSPPPANEQCAVRRSIDCWVELPAGRFFQGAQATDPGGKNYDPAAAPDEGPVREVTLSSFWIQVAEASATTMRRCIDEGHCDADTVDPGPLSTSMGSMPSPLPANAVSWEGAQQACRLVGGRLPTEAEWEYAARPDGRRFPWGDEPSCVGADAGAAARGGIVTPGGAAGCALPGPLSASDLRLRSEHGILGLGGNLWEWVADHYAADAYAGGDVTHPTGPSQGGTRVQRGGGFSSRDPLEFRGARRGQLAPSAKLFDVGFRCVWDPEAAP